MLNKEKKFSSLILYLSFWIVTVLVVLVTWDVFVHGWLYYCSGAVIGLDFLPPFVHGTDVGDYFKTSPYFVYLLWFMAVVVIFAVPLYLTKKATRDQ